VTVRVANYSAPTTAIAAPANNAVGLTGTVPVTTANTVAGGLSISRVELYLDGALYHTLTASPYTFSWNTLDAALPAYDGPHTLTSKVYDSAGQVTSSATVNATTGNTAATPYRAVFNSSPVPQAMLYIPGGPQLVYPVDVTVTNTSTQAWTGNKMCCATGGTARTRPIRWSKAGTWPRSTSPPALAPLRRCGRA
jgi:hypothetical protein